MISVCTFKDKNDHLHPLSDSDSAWFKKNTAEVFSLSVPRRKLKPIEVVKRLPKYCK